MRFEHTLSPFFDENSKVLILGSFPSPKSRELGFYYGHPQNRFWAVLSAILNENLPQTNDEKCAMLKRHNIALWDVLASCEIRGAEDSSIRAEIPNDLSVILDNCDIRAIFTTGNTACTLYRKHILPINHRDCIPLPSTSPANCRVSLNDLICKYTAICEYI